MNDTVTRPNRDNYHPQGRDFDDMSWDSFWSQLLIGGTTGLGNFFNVMMAPEAERGFLSALLQGAPLPPAPGYNPTEDFDRDLKAEKANAPLNGKEIMKQMAKAQKVMTEAGVDGPPTLENLKNANAANLAHNAAENARYQKELDAAQKALEDFNREQENFLRQISSQGAFSAASVGGSGSRFTTLSSMSFQDMDAATAHNAYYLHNHPLLKLIRYAEHRKEHFENNQCYNVVNGYESIIINGERRTLTDLTIAEAIAWSKDNKNRALGAYQFKPDTLALRCKDFKIPLSAKFDMRMQDFLGLKNLKACGYEKLLLGQSTPEQFLGNGNPNNAETLSFQWRSIATTKGTRVSGDRNNRLKVSAEQALQVINAALEYEQQFALGSSRLMRPVNMPPGQRTFGYKKHPKYGTVKFHAGVDTPTQSRALPILAPGNGTVVHVHGRVTSGAGLYSILRIGSNVYSTNFHQSRINVQEGQQVQKGRTILGYVGSTGTSTGHHDHWEVALAYYDTRQRKVMIVNVDPYKALQYDMNDPEAQKFLIADGIRAYGKVREAAWADNVSAQDRPNINALLKFDPTTYTVPDSRVTGITPDFHDAVDDPHDHDHDHGMYGHHDHDHEDAGPSRRDEIGENAFSLNTGPIQYVPPPTHVVPQQEKSS